MTAFDVSRIKEGVGHVRSLIGLFGDLRKQIAQIELRDFLPFVRRRSPGSAIAWFSAGVVTGAAAATLFSPKKGDQLRADMRSAAEKVGDRLANKWLARREARKPAPPKEASMPSSDAQPRYHPVHS